MQSELNTGDVIGIAIQNLDIAPTYYDLAAERYRSIGEWLHREGSSVASYDPRVYSQGSFRLGTVVKPLSGKDEYDLDTVCALTPSIELTQKELKQLLGKEIRGYAAAFKILAPVDEKDRCWRLDYADDVAFHIDILPGRPTGVRNSLYITDRTHPQYEVRGGNWPVSNPMDYALWFEGRMGGTALQQREQLVRQGAYRSIDEVPLFALKTPLQHAVQIFKRHRDIHFLKARDVRPISMIITTLAAHAYNGEQNILDALVGMASRMESYVSPTRPRIPNPILPGEDFADKWGRDPQLEQSFKYWMIQLKTDLDILASASREVQMRKLQDGFGINNAGKASMTASSRGPIIQIGRESPRPWRK